jgi:pimeloyl-ACP methyl ester carboxylesterase
MKQKLIRRTSLAWLTLVIAIAISFCSTEKDSLLIYYDSQGKACKVRNERNWEIRHNQILDSMQAVMGRLPDRKINSSYTILKDTSINGILRLRISFTTKDNDTVPAYLFIPAGEKKKVPGILCLHQTTGMGKGEPAGIGGSPNLHYALELAQRGYVTIAPDYPNFGDYHFDPYKAGYQSATMKGIVNHMQAIDVLQSLEQVDPEKIGCIGHSLGGHNSLFVAAFDRRIKVVVSSCGFTSFYKYYNGDLTGWSHKGYMPRIAAVYGKDPSRMPFDFPEVLAAIAPRAVFINAPLEDSNFDNSGVHDCTEAALKVYKFFGKTGNIVLETPDSQHDFPPAVREDSYKFLDRQLSENN